MEPSPYQQRAPRALVVDDDPLGLITTMEILNRLGMITEGNLTGPEALERTNTNRYDYIFLDIEMPGLSGYELCRAIRAEGCLSREALIFALSGHIHSHAHVAECLQAGMQDVLTKPITEEHLHRRIRSWKLGLKNNRLPPIGINHMQA